MSKPEFLKTAVHIAATLLLVAVTSLAQSSSDTKIVPVRVANVSSHATSNGTVVSIDADGPLNRAQTWQDREGYHIVVPSAGTQSAIKVGKGIKVRQLDHTLEIVIQTREGANVTVQPLANRLNLNVEGKLEPRSDSDARADRAQRLDEEIAASSSEAAKNARIAKSTDASPGELSSSAQPAAATTAAPPTSSQDSGNVQIATGESSVMSDTTVLIFLGVACIGGLLVIRRWRTGQAAATAPAVIDEEGFDDFSDFEPLTSSKPISDTIKPSSDVSGKANDANAQALQRKSAGRAQVALPSALYGAYQIDLEVAKLVQGQPHRMEVVGSRASDDRRAIEASLLKVLNSTSADEEMHRRARAALEEYGFVARHSATLLAASDPFERSSAARMLGDAKSAAALPFLLEALYDSESLVRNQAVLSIGELKLPSAIGALLDIARKHPDVPGSLLSKALNACSLEGLDFFDNDFPETKVLGSVDTKMLAEEILNLQPATPSEELPETSDDEYFIKAMSQIESQVIGQRLDGIKLLAQYPIKGTVTTLAKLARIDSESSLRSAAILSLAIINHESVFPAVLIAMADESREVRAAAARSLSRLSFDRADAYIRVTQSGDAESIRNVAAACIKAGIAAQSIDRLMNGDHQAYEAMAVVSMLVKAKSFVPLLNAIAHHPNVEARLTLVNLLALSGETEVVEQLRELIEDSHGELAEALQNAVATLDPTAESEPDNSEVVEQSASESEFESHLHKNASHIEADQTAEFLRASDEAAVADAPQTGADSSTDFAFEFVPAPKKKVENEEENEPKLTQFESSGLPLVPTA